MKPSAEGAAFAALAAGDAAGALAAARRSQAPTAYLRYLCGSARWDRRELHGALAEYEDALRLQPAVELAGKLGQQIAALREDLAPHAAAEAAGVRNGWLAAGVVLLGLCGAVLARRLG